MTVSIAILTAVITLVSALQSPLFAQSLTATSTSTVTMSQGVSPASMKRKLKEDLELRVLRNLLEVAFAVKFTSDVEQKLPQLIELLGDSIQIKFEPFDGEVMTGSATINVPSAKLKEYLANKGIGAGDIAAKSAKILVSIDEFIGVATTNDGAKATETETSYSHDKSTFSDTSSAATASASSASSDQKNTASSAKSASASSGSQSAKDSVAVSGSQSAKDSAAVSGSQSSSVSGRSGSDSVSASGRSGIEAKQSSESQSKFAGAAASESQSKSSQASASARASSDKSLATTSSASASSDVRKNVQQNTDKVSISVKTKMPEFNNAKALGSSDRVLASRLSGEFQSNGLKLVAENDLRSEGGRLLPIYEITNNGRIDQFVDLIKAKNIEADVWATGQANYTIVGTTPTGTECNGNLSVQGRFLEGNEIFFEDASQAAAVGSGDQDCRARLGIALATTLARKLGERANKELNARSSRGGVYTLYLYSASALKRSDRRAFTDALEKIEGLQSGEPTLKENHMSVIVQYAGKLKTTIDKILDKLPWDNAAVLDKANKICVGIEGSNACPLEFK